MAPFLARIRQRIAVRQVRATPADWRVTVKRRLSVAVIALVCWAASIEARLVYLQVAQHDEYVKLANTQQTGKEALSPKRGDIYDRNGHPLATSADGDYVWADPGDKDFTEPDAVVAALCRVLTCDQAERTDLTGRFSRKDRHFERVKRRRVRWLRSGPTIRVAPMTSERGGSTWDPPPGCSAGWPSGRPSSTFRAPSPTSCSLPTCCRGRSLRPSSRS